VQVGDSAEKMISGLESYKHAFEFHFHTRHVGGPHGTDRRLIKTIAAEEAAREDRRKIRTPSQCAWIKSSARET
jgi:hypothetical protein